MSRWRIWVTLLGSIIVAFSSLVPASDQTGGVRGTVTLGDGTLCVHCAVSIYGGPLVSLHEARVTPK